MWSGNVKAGLFDMFKDPVEVCMNRFEDKNESLRIAAQECRGITKGEVKCMDKLIKDGRSAYRANYICTGNSIFKNIK